jgi:hypothetical protein
MVKIGEYYMIKVNIFDHSTRKVLENFNPDDIRDLPVDLIGFIKKLPKGDKLKPLDVDTFQLSTYKTPQRKIYGCYDVPAERNIEIMLPRDEHCAYYACLTDNTEKLADKQKKFYPITVQGFKDAIRNIAKAKEVTKQAGQAFI